MTIEEDKKKLKDDLDQKIIDMTRQIMAAENKICMYAMREKLKILIETREELDGVL